MPRKKRNDLSPLARMLLTDMEKADKTQAELSRETGVTQACIASIMMGRTRNSTRPTLERLALALGRSADFYQDPRNYAGMVQGTADTVPAPELQTRCPGSATDESRIALADAVHTLAVKWDSLPALRQETLLRVIKDLCDVPGGRTTSKST